MKLLDRLFRREEFGDADTVYMIRWTLLRLFGWRIYLHRFMESDTGRDFHDHPCDVISLLFRGQYLETIALKPPLAAAYEPGPPPIVREKRTTTYWAPKLRFFRAEHIHRIDLLQEDRGRTWTLCLFFPKRQEWGFWLDDGTWIRWDVYHQRRNEA